jgi:hypothetical protein
VVVLVAGGWPFANCLLMAGLYGVMAIAVHWIGECTIKGARKRQEGNGSDQALDCLLTTSDRKLPSRRFERC